MDRWRGKVAIVTGASAGIGLAIVTDLVKNGVTTVALSRRPELVNAIKSNLSGSEGALLHSLSCDIADESSVNETFKKIRNNFKGVHILINNAGVFTKGTLINGPLENIKKTIDVNVVGLLHLTQETFKLMKENSINDGHIININSIAGHKVPNVAAGGGEFELNVYPATKHAVTVITEVLRLEVATYKLKTKVTSLSPGLIKTDIFKANEVDPSGSFFAGPHLQPKDVSDAVIYVLSTPANVNISEITIQPVGEPY